MYGAEGTKMIEYVIALVTSAIPLFLGDVGVASVILALSMIASPSTCPIICNNMIGVLMTSALLGVLINLLVTFFNLTLIQGIITLMISTIVLSIIYAYGLEKDIIEEISEWSVIVLVLVMVGTMYLSPELGSQAMYFIAGGIWVVSTDLAQVYLIIAMSILLISVVLRDHIVGTMFDKEYILAVGSNTYVRYFILSFLSVFGIAVTAYTIGLFATQTVLVLPVIISLKMLKKSIEEIVPYTFAISNTLMSLGAYLSMIYGISAIGASSAMMVLLIVLLKLRHSKLGRTRKT
ncbi:hypothetical protein IPA_04875 [Ignicoccus pacificus DSM 13166]|uniref:Uncharacterized protein n=1 Tax=Ignicoccus pacificus DSM 13166 TaxID=940294 RepID=A0A977KBA8_9CREN|nr:hypothetical protein IPA_04875 [Ignicoccus pacificus DSM 13166]